MLKSSLYLSISLSPSLSLSLPLSFPLCLSVPGKDIREPEVWPNGMKSGQMPRNMSPGGQ